MDYIVFTDEDQLLIEAQTQSRSDIIVDQLIKIRKDQGKTQQDIANITGMQRGNVARVERKIYVPTLEVLQRYAAALGYEINLNLEPKRD